MRSNKTIYGLLLVIVLFVIARVGMGLLTNQSPELGEYLKWWQKTDPTKVNQIVIDINNVTLMIDRQSDKSWKVNSDYVALPDEIDKMLSNLIKPTQVEIGSENPSMYEKLGIASSSATLTIKGEGANKKIVLGNSGSKGRYLQLEGIDKVFILSGLTNKIGSVAVADWIDKTIVKIDKESIAKIGWQRDEEVYAINKNGNEWFNDKGKKLETANISAIESGLSALTIDSVVLDPQSISDLPKDPNFVINIERNNQEPVSINFYEAKGQYFISTSTVKGLYLLPSTDYDVFNLKVADFKEKVE